MEKKDDIALKSKIFYLANLCIGMLQFLLQYLLQFSFKTDAYLRYWEVRREGGKEEDRLAKLP